MSQRRTPMFVWLVATAAAVCWAPATPLTGMAPAVGDRGAIIKVELRTKVGVLLDEVPAGRLRDDAAADALGQDDAFWREPRPQPREAQLLSPRLSGPHLRRSNQGAAASHTGVD